MRTATTAHWGYELRKVRMRAGRKLDPAFAEKLLNFIIAEVIRHHETIAKSS